MNEAPKQITEENPSGKSPNFHEISERRKELRKTLWDLLDKGGVSKKSRNLRGALLELSKKEGSVFKRLAEGHYKKPLEELDKEASVFKIGKNSNGGLYIEGAKEDLKKQKEQYQNDLLEKRSQIDYEKIAEADPSVIKVLDKMKEVESLEVFRMKRIFEIANPEISPQTKKLNLGIVETAGKEITMAEKEIDEMDQILVREAVLVKYKEELSRGGHVCKTPSVKVLMDEIGTRMLTGKPILLHGPTGTGKTSIARSAAREFTGKDPEMIYCNPQTRESNVFGRTGIRPAGGGAIKTVNVHGPLVKAMEQGKAVIFDEFTALPDDQMVFIKGVFNAKVGDKITISSFENGENKDTVITVQPGFMMIFTSNLKSEKNPERKALPPEMASEFEQNNLEVLYVPPDEAYDIAITRLSNPDGSIDMSFHDLLVTLPNLCRVMAEIQESYTNETDKEVARRAGVLDASGKVSSLKKFVMGQRSVEAIVSSYLTEKLLGKNNRSFAEFLDERFKTALTFKEYSKEDRILAAKILALKGFLTTLSPKDLDLPSNIFDLNTLKQLRGDDAVEEIKQKSGEVRHLTLKEVAKLDPFEKRKEALKKRADGLLEGEEGESDEFLNGIKARRNKIFGKKGKEKKSMAKTLSATFDYTDPQGAKAHESIELDIDKKIQEFKTLYQKTGIDLPPDFEDTIRDIWTRNYDEIEKEAKIKGFNEILLIPANIPLPELADKMKMEDGYYQGDNFENAGGFATATSPNSDKPRLILVHNVQNIIEDTKYGGKATANITNTDAQKHNPLSLAEYIIFQRNYFDKTGNHLDEKGGTWTSSSSGARLVCSYWLPVDRKLYVSVHDPGHRHSTIGVRPARCFY